MKSFRIMGTSLGSHAMAYGPEDHVASAFTKRKWLVKLRYAREVVVVAISNTEAASGREAVYLANKRAQKALSQSRMLGYDGDDLRYGDLIEGTFLPDCQEAREQFGVAGPSDPAVSRTSMYAA